MMIGWERFYKVCSEKASVASTNLTLSSLMNLHLGQVLVVHYIALDTPLGVGVGGLGGLLPYWDIENIAPGNPGRLGLVRFGMRPRRRVIRGRVVSRRIDVVSLFADISRVNSYFERLDPD